MFAFDFVHDVAEEQKLDITAFRPCGLFSTISAFQIMLRFSILSDFINMHLYLSLNFTILFCTLKSVFDLKFIYFDYCCFHFLHKEHVLLFFK